MAFAFHPSCLVLTTSFTIYLFVCITIVPFHTPPPSPIPATTYFFYHLPSSALSPYFPTQFHFLLPFGRSTSYLDMFLPCLPPCIFSPPHTNHSAHTSYFMQVPACSLPTYPGLSTCVGYTICFLLFLSPRTHRAYSTPFHLPGSFFVVPPAFRSHTCLPPLNFSTCTTMHSTTTTYTRTSLVPPFLSVFSLTPHAHSFLLYFWDFAFLPFWLFLAVSSSSCCSLLSSSSSFSLLSPVSVIFPFLLLLLSYLPQHLSSSLSLYVSPSFAFLPLALSPCHPFCLHHHLPGLIDFPSFLRSFSRRRTGQFPG